MGKQTSDGQIVVKLRPDQVAVVLTYNQLVKVRALVKKEMHEEPSRARWIMLDALADALQDAAEAPQT